VSTPARYELVLTPPAQRAISSKLPEAVATAVIDFLAASLLDNPYRVGKPLGGELSGIWAARRGTYRVLYRINDSFTRLWSYVSNTVATRID